MPDPRTYPIPPNWQGLRLETALKRLAKDLSWSQVRALISGRFVRVNGVLAIDADRGVGAGDVIEVTGEAQAAPPGDVDVEVVHADADVVVVNKPAGMMSLRRYEERGWEEARKFAWPALDEVLQRLANAKRLAGGGSVRVLDVHRLDRETSGLMVFARTVAARDGLVELFKRHSVDRRYWAVVRGHPATMRIESWLVRDRGDGLRGSAGGVNVELRAEGEARKPARPAELAASASATGWVPSVSTAELERRGGERAVTHVRPVERLGEYSIVECRLETGRTHQIRIHLSEAGFSLCGERVYTHGAGEAPRVDGSGAPRQALHAFRLGFRHPATGERVEFERGWAEDLAGWLGRLRSV
ncbi:MAG TPA: RluA family pseudouridine synthase [Tepidisphaeraceae bacterium]|nr:RluA family pseudouridine synthase [Tepidisphaeraceae bacterium]